MNRGLEHLLPKTSKGAITPETKAELDTDRLAHKEHSFVCDVLKAYGWSTAKIASHSTQVERGCLDFYWLQYEAVTNHHFDWAEVKTYDIHRLFDAPTTTQAYEKYVEKRQRFEQSFKEQWRDELIMPFSCRDMSGGYYAIHDSPWLRCKSKVYLVFTVRGKQYYIQPWKSVLGAIRNAVEA